MTLAAPENQATQNRKTKVNGQAKPGRAISDPKEVAQLVMMRNEPKGSASHYILNNHATSPTH